MLATLLEASSLRPGTKAWLLERSGGNPLFLQELVAAVQSPGGIDVLPDTVEALISSDFAPVQGFVLTMAVMYVLLNLAIDILYGVIDPRVRLEG